MGKNKNNKPKAMPEAPAAQPATTEVEVINESPVTVMDMSNFVKNVTSVSQEGLDPNRRVDLLRIMHETFRTDKDAAAKYNMPQETVDKINSITAIGMVSALACEAKFGKNPFAISMSKAQLLQLSEVGKDLGITFDVNAKALPNLKDNDTVEVQSSEIKVSKEAEAQMKEEQKVKDENPSISPTEIKTEEDLVKALIFIMADRPNAFDKIAESINFYQAYLKFSNKDNEEMLAKINNMTRIELLKEIREKVGRCPFVLNGMGRSMATFTAKCKSPIPAFCMFRNTAKNKTTGIPAIDDNEVADYVRTLVEWVGDVRIAEYTDKIETYKADIKELSKNKKQNQKGIDDLNEKIATCETSIAHVKEINELVTNPGADVPNNLLSLRAEKDTEASRIFNYIVGTYYSDVDTKTIEIGTLAHNVEQYAGLIHNMFRDPSSPLVEFAEANILPIEAAEEKEEEEEKESKK